jgi:acetyl esterase/lipase
MARAVRMTARAMRVAILMALLVLGAGVISPVASAAGRAILDVPYVQQSATADRRQTLDIYLPEPSSRPPPLLVFIHGGFWVESDDKWGISRAIADDLTPDGVAVALLRYRLGSEHPHPAQIEDVAAGLAHLTRDAKKHGYDPSRIVVAGHSAGGHLAALLALQPQHLAKHGIKPTAIRCILAISGIYSLELSPRWRSGQRVAIQHTFGADDASLAAASPLEYTRADAPRFIIAAADRDLDGLQEQARRFADALVAAGAKQVDPVVLPEHDHFSIVRLSARGNPLKSLMLDALDVRPLPKDMAELMAAKRTWNRPPFSTEPFWRHKDLVETKPIDRAFTRTLAFFFRGRRFELSGLPLEHYHAVDLFRFLDTVPGGGGDYVLLKNIRDEAQVWHRDEIRPYKPVIVIGLDGEKNLFKLAMFYQMLREYSWRDGPAPPYMALPLGAFIYFENAPPPNLRPQLWHYSLTIEGIRAAAQDPYAKLRALPPDLLAVLTEGNGCVFCHTVRDVGSRSHHVTGIDPKAHGGFALPLESYPPDVFGRFLFHQEEVAQRMGATPNRVDGPARDALLQLIVEGRGRKQLPKSPGP